MSFSLFFVFFFATVLFCITFLSLQNSRRLQEGKDVGNKGGLAVTASLILGWIFLQIATPIGSFPFDVFIFGFYPFLIGAAGLSMYSIAKGPIPRFWVYFFITILSVAFLPNDWMVFQGFFPLFFDRFATAVLWALFISMYARMDKVVGLTLIQTSALCLGFALFPLMAFRFNVNYSFSDLMTFYPMIILGALIGFMTFQKRHPDLLMGKTAAVPFGYLMFLFLILMAIKGYWLAIIIMPAYYYFETVYSFINRLIHYKNPEPVAFTFFISHVVRNNLNNRGIIPFLMIIMLGLSLNAFVFGSRALLLMLSCGGILLAYALYRLMTWDQPKITYRSMFHDTKDATIQLADNAKESVNTVVKFFNRKKKK